MYLERQGPSTPLGQLSATRTGQQIRVSARAPPPPAEGGTRLNTFIVQLRNGEARTWGNQAEISAMSAKQAAEQAAGGSLRAGPGERVHLRARVWPTPFGSRPDIPFYNGSAPTMCPGQS